MDGPGEGLQELLLTRSEGRTTGLDGSPLPIQVDAPLVLPLLREDDLKASKVGRAAKSRYSSPTPRTRLDCLRKSF